MPDLVALCAGVNTALGVTTDGSLIQWGNYVDNEEEKVNCIVISPYILTPQEGVFFYKVSCNQYNYAAITVDGKLYTWGFAENG